MADREEIVKIFSELRNIADNDVQPVVWYVYSKLCDLIDQAEEYVLAMLKEQEAVTIKKTKEHGFGVYGGLCPKCRNWIQSGHSFCGFCGQKVKWE